MKEKNLFCEKLMFKKRPNFWYHLLVFSSKSVFFYDDRIIRFN